MLAETYLLKSIPYPANEFNIYLDNELIHL